MGQKLNRQRMLGLSLLVTSAAILCGKRSHTFAQVSGFVQTDGIQFKIDGRPVHFAGTNNYYQMIHRRTGNSSVDEVLDEMEARSMTVLRTWAFQEMAERSDCLQCAPVRQLGPDERPVDFIDEATLVALDQTLAEADARGIRVVLTLVNNWDDFGGVNRYTLWRFGYTDHDRFYSDALIKDWFKDLIQLLVYRVNTVNGRMYHDDPAIFAWQLTNEARSSSAAAGDLNDWMGEMSAYIKGLDSNHMVSTGIEGFYGTARAGRNTDSWMQWNGQDFIDNHQHATIDYATCHIWPQNWGWDPIGNTPAAMNKATQYLQQRMDDAQQILAKPLMLDEFGIPRDNHGLGINSGASTVREQFYDQVYYAMCEASARNGGPLVATANWIIFDDATESYDDGNGVFLPWDTDMDAILTSHARMLADPNPDLDWDGDVDGDDISSFQACMTGPNAGPAAAECLRCDFDRDTDLDQSDFGILQRCLTGPNNPPDPNCLQ
ncbi:MAG: glycoside hydrolase 5 family protein [Planctomycetota bacterium]